MGNFLRSCGKYMEVSRAAVQAVKPSYEDYRYCAYKECGKPISLDRFAHAKYCSSKCQQRAGNAMKQIRYQLRKGGSSET